jgi:hypothetical protein
MLYEYNSVDSCLFKANASKVKLMLLLSENRLESEVLENEIVSLYKSTKEKESDLELKCEGLINNFKKLVGKRI